MRSSTQKISHQMACKQWPVPTREPKVAVLYYATPQISSCSCMVYIWIHNIQSIYKKIYIGLICLKYYELNSHLYRVPQTLQKKLIKLPPISYKNQRVTHYFWTVNPSLLKFKMWPDAHLILSDPNFLFLKWHHHKIVYEFEP